MGGLVIFAVGFHFMSLADVNTVFWTLVFVTMISRLGLGFINPSLNASSLKVLPPDKVRQGAGATNFMRQLGGALGTVLFVAVLETRGRFHAEALTATQDYANHATDRLMHQVETLLKTVGLTERVRHNIALDYLGTVVHAQSQTLAFQDTFMVVGGVTLLALLPAYILSRSQRRDMRGAD
jgi:hypothetical protein